MEQLLGLVFRMLARRAMTLKIWLDRVRQVLQEDGQAYTNGRLAWPAPWQPRTCLSCSSIA